jgi:hypothetical protein
MNKHLFLSTMALIFFTFPAQSAEKQKEKRSPARSPTNFEVQQVAGSGQYKPEKWIDKDNNVVCYVAQGTGSGSGISMSCVRVDSAQ